MQFDSEIKALEYNVQELSKLLNRNQGEYDFLKRDYESNLLKISSNKTLAELTLKSIEVLNLVQGVTRDRIKKEFEGLVTYVLQFVTEEAYEFVIEFGTRGNLQELTFRLKSEDNEEPFDILDTRGGGLIDLISFALRVVLMETSCPKIQGFIVLDESFKHLSENYLVKIPLLLQELSKKLNRQLIVISHESELIENNFNSIQIKKEK